MKCGDNVCQCLANIRCIARKIGKICVNVWATLNKFNADEFMQNEQQQRQHKEGEEMDAAQASKKTSEPGILAHYFELLKEEQVKIRFEMQRMEEENKKNLKKETQI